jgi:UDP-N-acetyl-2-amino-2-deoxyglucuronate dehydrogenase
MKKLKIAVVGCGRVSRTAHYSSLLKHNAEFYDFKAVCDIDRKRADHWATENKVKAYYRIEDLLEKEDLDLVSICVPNGLHPKLGIKAAQAGVNVIVEKPMAMNIDDADALIDACQDAGVKLFVVKQNRYNKTNKLLKSCIDKGRFGRISTCNMTVSWRREMPYYIEDHKWRSRRDLSGGVFTNQSVHYIDMMQWLVGAPPETAYAKMGTLHPVDVEDHGAGSSVSRMG